MIQRVALVVAVVCVAILPMAGHAASVEKFRNEKVVVTEVTLGTGESEAETIARPSIIVWMVDGTALTTVVNARNDRGETRPATEGSTLLSLWGNAPAVKNMASAPLRFARIVFLTDGSNERWGSKGLAPGYRVMLDDKYARMYEIKVPAGAVEPQHTHHARVVVCLSGTEMEHILPDGTKQLVTLKTGDILWREAATHAGHNVGKMALWEIAVEPK